MARVVVRVEVELVVAVRVVRVVEVGVENTAVVAMATERVVARVVASVEVGIMSLQIRSRRLPWHLQHYSFLDLRAGEVVMMIEQTPSPLREQFAVTRTIVYIVTVYLKTTSMTFPTMRAQPLVPSMY